MDKPFFGHDPWTFLSFHIVKVTTYEAEMSRNYLTVITRQKQRKLILHSISVTKTRIGNLTASLKEFVIYKDSIQIKKYSYHYTLSNRLVFRYDNALDPAARHLPTYPHHKHLSSSIVASDHHRLSDVLQEISLHIKL